ncbi:50S ribosomal protein L15 [Quillaja saponaria]|uniref:50S ribosomal protein L15 n=1 Tax=Quillaja saponaria TaxID=32244 RepID=A0AAD7QCC1_QUISA|nr:50S ribosomal protein L15 [Quillaja saponaria]
MAAVTRLLTRRCLSSAIAPELRPQLSPPYITSSFHTKPNFSLKTLASSGISDGSCASHLCNLLSGPLVSTTCGPLNQLGLRSYSLLSLNDLRDRVPRKQKTRKGRGIGSGKGKTAGRGHKGQKARGSGKLGFEGGQTPLRRRLPKRGFKNPFSLTFQPVGLGKIAYLINKGKIDSSELITMKTLKDTGAIGKQIKDGVRLMARGAEKIKWPIHLEVSRVTVRAKEAVEAAGGSVRRVYYNKLGFRALLTPEWFEKKGRLLPRAARPPPKQRDKVDSIGRLPAPTKPIPFSAEEKEALPC